MDRGGVAVLMMIITPIVIIICLCNGSWEGALIALAIGFIIWCWGVFTRESSGSSDSRPDKDDDDNESYIVTIERID